MTGERSYGIFAPDRGYMTTPPPPVVTTVVPVAVTPVKPESTHKVAKAIGAFFLIAFVLHAMGLDGKTEYSKCADNVAYKGLGNAEQQCHGLSGDPQPGQYVTNP